MPGVSWRYFTNKDPNGEWDAYDAISAVYTVRSGNEYRHSGDECLRYVDTYSCQPSAG